MDEPHDHLAGMADDIANRMLARTLPKSRWTHEGHLLTCIALVRRLGRVEALTVLRGAIPPYNVATGVANTSTGGYHDTITAYYVWAIDRLVGAGLSTTEMLWHPSTERDALLAWWDRSTLFSQRARAAWVDPVLTGDGPTPREWLQGTSPASAG